MKKGIDQITYNAHIENGKIVINEPKLNWKLVRARDGLIRQSNEILFTEFNDDNTFKAKHKDIKVGYSLIMSPFNRFFTWMTTEITEIIEQKDGYCHFKTKNSTYTLTKI